MNDSLSYSIRKKGCVTILDLYGKIIGSRAFTLKEELFRLKDSGSSKVILNFQGVSSIDSLGVMAIISALESGLSVKIIHLNPSCKEILGQNRASHAIPVFGTEEDAIGNLSRQNSISKEMRRYKRINTNIPVEIYIANNRQRGVLLNISEGGALVGYLDPISIEPYNIRHISVMMELPLIGAIELEGKPVRFGRTSEMNIVGIEILSTEKSKTVVKEVYKKNPHPSNQPPFSYD